MIKIKSGYSFRVAVGTLDEVMARLQTIEAPFAALTDRASTFGFVRWGKMAKKAGLKPVYGVELAVTDSLTAKKPTVDHWTFIAKDELGPLNLLIKLATSQFRYEPLISFEQAQTFAPGELIRIVGRRSRIELISPQDDLFVALAPSAAKGYINAVRTRGLKLIAASDNKYPAPGDAGFYEVVAGRGASTQTYDQFIQSESEWRASVARVAAPAEVEEALSNARAAGGAARAELRPATLPRLVKPVSLEALARAGAAAKGVNLSDPVYAARFEREITLIKEKNFEDYHHIIADIMRYARKVMLCGPGRGSSAGSLICYLLDITAVDPIPYGLIFERYIDINRDDLPDIDLDFSDDKRHLVFKYIEETYGKTHVARLGAVALYRPRSALDEAGAALKAPRWLIDKVVDSLIVRSSGDSRALNTLEDTLSGTAAGKELLSKSPEIKIAARMEGHPRHYSQHAAGIIITSTPVTDYVAIDARSGATMCDKKDAEDLEMLKIDALGLTQLSVFEDALTMAGKDIHFLERVPLDDQAAFEVLNKHQFSGIFQFNGPALQSITNQVRIESLNDIVAITALARPGPLASGGTSEWVKRKTGKSPITYPDPALEPYLKETQGIITYQEQVMQIARDIGDLSWEDVSTLRKAMSKSLGKEFFDHYGHNFKVGAIKNNINPAVLDRIWDDLCSYGSMGFNKAHAVSYGIISYWCAYMKAHYPFEFAAATLSHEMDAMKQIFILREMSREGFDYVPVDAELSTDKWTAGTKEGRRVLLGPLSSVKGIGPKLVSQIIAARAVRAPLPDRAEKLLANPKTNLDSLWPIRGRLKEIMPDPAARSIFTRPTNVIDVQTNGHDYSVLAFVTFKQIKPRDENEAIDVAKRGFELKGPTSFINLTAADDTDQIFAKIGRFQYEKLGVPIIERGRPGKALYAIKGIVPRDFRMIRVEAVRYIGDMDDLAEMKKETVK